MLDEITVVAQKWKFSGAAELQNVFSSIQTTIFFFVKMTVRFWVN